MTGFTVHVVVAYILPAHCHRVCVCVCVLLLQGDLGAIDDRYDVAISTACGPLDNIVVDTMETAQQCVAFLKSNNLGLATFIGMDKVRHYTIILP